MENKGADKLDYNAFNWHAINADGVEKDIDFTSDNEDLLDSGNLIAGGKVSGKVYFKGDIQEVNYQNILNNKAVASWKVSE